MKKDLKILLSNLCCSRCKTDFDENSVKILKDENGLCTVNIICQNCGKDFGTGFLNLSDNDKSLPLEIKEGLEPVNYDDVIDAHNYIKKYNISLINDEDIGSKIDEI